LASGAASTRECVAGMDSWRRELPLDTQEVLARHEANQDYSHPDYVEAMDTLYRRNFCRVWPWPEPLKRGSEHMAMPCIWKTTSTTETSCSTSSTGSMPPGASVDQHRDDAQLTAEE
jgi:hypothetical protein